jgi:hypothetical protein
MIGKKYDKVLPFILECVLSLIGFILIFAFVLWTRFQFIFFDIVFLYIAIFYYRKVLITLIKIIQDIRKNNIITEIMYIKFFGEVKFDTLTISNIFKPKTYFLLQCHKLNGNKFTNEVVDLKYSKNIEFKEKSYAKVTYYKNSKIVSSIDL